MFVYFDTEMHQGKQLLSVFFIIICFFFFNSTKKTLFHFFLFISNCNFRNFGKWMAKLKYQVYQVIDNVVQSSVAINNNQFAEILFLFHSLSIIFVFAWFVQKSHANFKTTKTTCWKSNVQFKTFQFSKWFLRCGLAFVSWNRV